MLASRLTTVLMTLISAVALASGGDPILGAWTGNWVYQRTDLLDGELDAAHSGEFESEIEITFQSDHAADLFDVRGRWKKDDGIYRINASKAATDLLIFDSSDPNATAILKVKRIRVLGHDELTGKIRAIHEFTSAGKRHKNTFAGRFVAAPRT